MNGFYDELEKRKRFPKLFQYREKLIVRYYAALKRAIDFDLNHVLIKVKIHSIHSGNPSEFILNQLKKISNHITLCNDDDEADLSISDRLYIHFEQFREKLFIWSSLPNYYEIERLKLCLEDLLLEKCRKYYLHK